MDTNDINYVTAEIFLDVEEEGLLGKYLGEKINFNAKYFLNKTISDKIGGSILLKSTIMHENLHRFFNHLRNYSSFTYNGTKMLNSLDYRENNITYKIIDPKKISDQLKNTNFILANFLDGKIDIDSAIEAMSNPVYTVSIPFDTNANSVMSYQDDNKLPHNEFSPMDEAVLGIIGFLYKEVNRMKEEIGQSERKKSNEDFLKIGLPLLVATAAAAILTCCYCKRKSKNQVKDQNKDNKANTENRVVTESETQGIKLSEAKIKDENVINIDIVPEETSIKKCLPLFQILIHLIVKILKIRIAINQKIRI